MEFKGTKGKWVIDKTMGIVNSINNIGDNVVCMAPDPVCRRSLNNWDANALLISKAPEMLEFLNQLVYACENGLIEDLQELGFSAEKLIKEATEL